jgi:hypothetical protein
MMEDFAKVGQAPAQGEGACRGNVFRSAISEWNIQEQYVIRGAGTAPLAISFVQRQRRCPTRLGAPFDYSFTFGEPVTFPTGGDRARLSRGSRHVSFDCAWLE